MTWKTLKENICLSPVIVMCLIGYPLIIGLAKLLDFIDRIYKKPILLLWCLLLPILLIFAFGIALAINIGGCGR